MELAVFASSAPLHTSTTPCRSRRSLLRDIAATLASATKPSAPCADVPSGAGYLSTSSRQTSMTPPCCCCRFQPPRQCQCRLTVRLCRRQCAPSMLFRPYRSQRHPHDSCSGRMPLSSLEDHRSQWCYRQRRRHGMQHCRHCDGRNSPFDIEQRITPNAGYGITSCVFR